MKSSSSMIVVALVFIAISSVSAVSFQWSSNLWNIPGDGSYANAITDATKFNSGIDNINKAACAAKGNPDKLNDECDKPKLSKVNAEEGGTGTQNGIEPLKDNVKEDLKQGAKKGEDVCGYNQACPKAAEEFKKKYKECIQQCCDAKPCILIPYSDPPQCTLTGCAGSYIASKKQEAVKMCRASSNEIQKCNKDASDAANKKGNEEIKKKQDDKPQGTKMTSPQQEHCLRVIDQKGKCDEVQKVATPDTISRLSNSDQGLISSLTLKCPMTSGLNCGPWDKCDKSTIEKSNCGLGRKIDNTLGSKGSSCSINSGTAQTAAWNYGIAETCGGEPKC